MALLGAQLVITLIMISVIQKLGAHFSFGRWLMCSTGLIRYLYPTDTELRQLANIPKDKSKSKKGDKTNGKHKADTFHIPRNVDVRLDTAKVSPYDVIHLKYYVEYQWLTDFSCYACLVYLITEVYQTYFPLKDEMNLSMWWCGLVLLFCVKILLSLSIQYFKGEESVGERSTCIVMGFTYLVISMVILIIDENILELGLDSAYDSFNSTASILLPKHGLNSSGPASKIILKFFLALWCGIIGALFCFPGLRIAKMHWDLLKYFRESKIKQMLLNVNFTLPFLIVILWIKPLARTYLTVRVFSGRTEPLLTDAAFESLRLTFIVVTMSVKLILTPWYMQAYLDMAYHRNEDQKKEVGRITNIEYQKKIAAVFYYLCVVALQYLIPVIMCLYLTFMYKTLGSYTWTSILGNQTVISPTSTDTSNTTAQEPLQDAGFGLENLRQVFSVEVFRGLLGFSTWWCCFAYFAATSVGLIYQSYFSTS